MPEKMKAMALTAPKTIVPMAWDKPVVTPGNVLIRNLATGICGSDLHVFNDANADGSIPYPYLLGHESAGEVVEVGEGVTNLKVGDRVTMEPGYTCGKCIYCKTGRYNLCPDVIFFATVPVQGTLCEYVSHPADMCFKLPDNVDAVEGALVEPLAVGLHAVNLGDAKPGKSAIVLGSGCIGLCTMLALNAYGIHDVYITDVLDLRLDMAKSLGGKTLNASQVDVGEYIMDQTHGFGIDMVFDTTGSPAATATAVDLAARGGYIGLVGIYPSGQGTFPINFGKILDKEVSIQSIFRYRNLYPTAIAAVKAGLPLKKIVSHYYSFDQAGEGFTFNTENKADVVKAVITY